MSAQKKKNKRKIYLEILVIVVFAVASVFIIIALIRSKQANYLAIESLEEKKIELKEKLKIKNKLNIFEILDKLEKFGNWPVYETNPHSTPRSNPFTL